MGQNIGTCATALISGIGASKNARRASLVHLYFNLIGTALFMALFYTFHAGFEFEFLGHAANGAGIAFVHSVFNIAATIVLLPFSGGLERLAVRTIPDTAETSGEKSKKKKDAGLRLLDERFLEHPGFAVAQAKGAAHAMAGLVDEALTLALQLNGTYEKKAYKRVRELEERADMYEDALGTYLVRLCAKPLTEQDNHMVTTLLHAIGDMERMADHAVALAENAKRMHREDAHFSGKAAEELSVLAQALAEIRALTFGAFIEGDAAQAAQVEPLGEVIHDLKDEIRARHIRRLAKGKCTIGLGFALTDFVTNCERIADHCSNIAVAVIQIDEDAHDVHHYLGQLKAQDAGFAACYERCSERYVLP